MKPKLFREQGQALIVIALAAIALFGIAGLAIDGSIKFSDRRHAQNAADAAALAAALSKGAGEANWKLKAVDSAYDNGYDSTSPTESVSVYSCEEADATCGTAYAGNSNYVQVIIVSNVNTYFARIVGIQQTHNTVQAVAFAQKGGTLGDGAMLISYDPDPNCSTGGTGGYSVEVSGSSSVNLNGGGIFLNSDEVCGFKIPNCADLNITGAAGISSVGANNIDQEGCAKQVPELPNQSPIAIPDDVSWPDVPSECNTVPKYPVSLGVDSSDNRGEWLIYPGYYETFPPTNLVSNKQHIYMASGVYCIDPAGPSKDFDLSWSPVDFVSLNGSTDPSQNKYHSYNPDGVTLYIKSGGGFSINSNNPTYLDGSTSGDYQGYLIILEGDFTSIESCSIAGGANVDINGMIFAPYCNITVNGGSSSTAQINAQLLGWDLKIDGGAGINFRYDPKYAVYIKRRIGLMK